jgi:hypothetical protein
MQGFPVQASCHQSASTASPFARKLVPYTLAAQEEVHVVRQDGRIEANVDGAPTEPMPACAFRPLV